MTLKFLGKGLASEDNDDDFQVLCLSFDPQYNVLVNQGLMLSVGELEWLQEKIQVHLKHTPLELEAIGRRTVEENHPTMVDQFNYDYFK